MELLLIDRLVMFCSAERRLRFTLDSTLDWRLNLDVCGHTLWVFDNLLLGIRNLLRIQPAPGVAV